MPVYGYSWFVNSTPVHWDTTNTYVSLRRMLYNGDTIRCIVQGSGPCGEVDGSAYLIIKFDNVGVHQITSGTPDLKVLPNPSKGEFIIKGSMGTIDDEVVFLEMTDMVGQVVYKNQIKASNGNINENVQLKNMLPNGMYLLNVRSGLQNKVFHIVIEQ